MDKSTHRLVPASIAVVGALAGFILRRWQLQSAFDQSGRAVAGHPAGITLGLVCALSVLALAVLCLRLPKRSGYEESFSSGKLELAVSALAALLLIFGSALSLMSESGLWMRIVYTLGILGGLCIAVTAAQRFRGVVPSLALHVLPCIFLAVRLVFTFKRWSVDPVVQDYCYDLFAAISAMLAVYHLGGFCLNRGQRRLNCFWCLCGLLFAAISLAGGDWATRLLGGGAGFWCAINGWQLLEEDGREAREA